MIPGQIGQRKRKWSYHFLFSHWDRRNKGPDSEAIDDATSHEHAIVDRSSTDGGTNGENHCGPLDSLLATKLVGNVRACDTTDG